MLTLHKKNAYKRYHMKAIFFLLLFPLCSVAQSTTQYLVTKSNDTIHYKGDLIVNNNDITKWRRITADGTEYSISEIKAAYFNHNYYYNCDSRHLYKQVVKGKINVYALNDRDTITDRHGNLRKEVFIEKTIVRKPVVYTLRSLIPMITDNESLSTQIRDENSKRNGGNAMIITGIAAGAPATIGGLFVAFISSLFGENQTANDALTVAGAGVAFGGGMIGGGAALKASTQKPNLELIHWYNAH